jgi:hypothetical protein
VAAIFSSPIKEVTKRPLLLFKRFKFQLSCVWEEDQTTGQAVFVCHNLFFYSSDLFIVQDHGVKTYVESFKCQLETQSQLKFSTKLLLCLK